MWRMQVGSHVSSANMAQGPDRWASKILSLPVFSDAFAQAIHGSPFSNLAFVAAMEVGSAHEFVSKVGDWAPQLDESIRDDLLSSTFMLEQFWSLACSVEKAFFESTANQLGFGLCEAPAPPISAVSAKARRAGAIKALSGKTVNPPRKFLKTSPEPQSATPLLKTPLGGSGPRDWRRSGERRGPSRSCCSTHLTRKVSRMQRWLVCDSSFCHRERHGQWPPT